MLFSCRKYVILERPSWKLPSALSENCVSIFIYFCINIDTNPAGEGLTLNFSITKLSDAQRARLNLW